MNNSTEGLQVYDLERVNTTVYLLGITCGVWTICANLVILVCFYRNRRRPWTNFSRQTCSMTISDLLVGLTAIPFLIIEQRDGRADTSICITTFYLFLSIQSVTLLHVLGICIFRNIKLKSMSDATQTSRHAVYANCVIITAWVLALGVVVIPFPIWSNKDSDSKLCYFDSLFGSNHRKAFMYMGTFYMISQVLTNIIYLITCLRLWMALRRVVPVNDPNGNTTAAASTSTVATVRYVTNTNIQNTGTQPSISLRMPASHPLTSTLRNQKQVIGTIGILLLLFNVFTLPITMGMLVGVSQHFKRTLRFVVCELFVINSGLNPIVYATRITSLRAAVRNVFREITTMVRF